jgi:hypothetical protein
VTIQEIEARVHRIRAIASKEISSASSDAAAHAEEDELHVMVLRAIADGAERPGELARAALETSSIDFSRWYE